MKNLTFWLCFAGGFTVSFLPLLLFPNGWILILGPFVGFYHMIETAFYGPFLFAAVQAVRGKKGAPGWVLGSIVSVTIGLILVFSTGFNFVPV